MQATGKEGVMEVEFEIDPLIRSWCEEGRLKGRKIDWEEVESIASNPDYLNNLAKGMYKWIEDISVVVSRSSNLG
jgi:hypothetical protein